MENTEKGKILFLSGLLKERVREKGDRDLISKKTFERE